MAPARGSHTEHCPIQAEARACSAVRHAVWPDETGDAPAAHIMAGVNRPDTETLTPVALSTRQNPSHLSSALAGSAYLPHSGAS
ncbi:hypothetical protein [Acetobacter senegalensis]|uniref:hypothetical protein n=1 Tax=Acetobacter senegalensis TaxID=446692 RepID=UPI002650526D|nr:hypothetical protein [Acetobacter senegalensis]MDN7356057.1 hypothetical protein [Acetobacter senegalensis]